ncbi:MAG: ABC transporter permease [Acidobacteriota bacterium]|nr:ABC transporter permease [Acidobacteriota bacterium]
MKTSPAKSASPLGRSLLRIYLKEARYDFLKLWRMPAYALPTILFPTMFYILFGLIFAKRPGADSRIGLYYLATFGAFAVIAASLFALGVGVAGERGQGWLEVKRASPMPPMAYFTAKVITSMTFGLIIVLILMGLAIGLGGVRVTLAQALTLLAVEVLGAVPFCAMGLAIGYFAGPNSAPAIVNLIYMPLAFFSGLWIPIGLFPRILQHVALILPPYHLGEMALGVVGMGDGEANWVHMAVLGAFAALCLVLARVGFRRDEGKLYG